MTQFSRPFIATLVLLPILFHSAPGFAQAVLFTVGKNDPTAQFNTADFATDDAAIQAAMNAAAAQGGGTVQMGAGTYDGFAQAVRLKSNVTLMGAGEGLTILKDSVNFDDQINSDPNVLLSNAGMRDFTIDVGSHANRTGFKVSNFENFTLSNVTVKNIAEGGWGGYFGVDNAATNPARNDGLSIEDLTVESHYDSSLESVLIFNTDNVSGNIHLKDRKRGPGVGLWQNVQNADLTVTGEDTETGPLLYYSYSTEDLVLDVSGTNVHQLVQGGNESDHGLFGYDRIENVVLTVSGSGTGEPGAGVQLGGLDGAVVNVGTLSGFEVPVLIDEGNAVTHNFPSTNFTINLGSIAENNPGDNVHALHPGILFVNASQVNGIIQGGEITTTNGFQLFPIAFEGGVASNLIVANTDLTPGPGGESVRVSGSAALGAGVQFVNIPNPVVTNPALSAHFINPAQIARFAQHADLKIENTAELLGSGDGILAMQNPFGSAAYFDIEITNSGTINVDGIGVNAKTLETAGQSGTSDISIVNSGTIAGQLAAIQAETASGRITIENSGTLMSAAPVTVLLDGNSNDMFTNTQTGTVSGPVALDMGAGDDIADLSGTVNGGVHMGTGADTLKLREGLLLTDFADGGDGRDRLELIGAQAWDIQRLQNFEDLATLGDVTLTGTGEMSRTTTFGAGTVTLSDVVLTTPNATIETAASVRVTQSSAIVGDVDHQGQLRVNEGQIFRINGDLTAQSGSQTTLGLSSTGIGRMQATGALRFAAGSSLVLDVSSTDGIFDGAEFNLADGGILSFAGNTRDSSALYDFDVFAQGTTLIARAQKVMTLGQTAAPGGANLSAAARVLDAIIDQGGLNTIRDLLAQQSDEEVIRDILRDLAPEDDFGHTLSVIEQVGGLSHLLEHRSSLQASPLASRGFLPRRSNPLVWQEIRYHSNAAKADATTGGYTGSGRLAAVGAEFVGTDRHLGFALATATSDLTGTGASDNMSGSQRGETIAAYGGWRTASGLDLSASLQFGGRKHQNRRRIVALGETAVSTFDSQYASVALGLAHSIQHRLGWRLNAAAHLVTARVWQDGYTETGSSANLAVAPQTYSNTDASARLSAEKDFDLRGATVTGFGSVGLAHTFGSTANSATARYTAGGPNFVVSNSHRRNARVELEIGANVNFPSGWQLRSTISHSKSSETKSTRAGLRVGFQF